MRILAIANAHALAHVSRLLEIAKQLRAQGHEICFAGHGRYLQIAAGDGFAVEELPYVSLDRVVQAVRSQRLWQLFPQREVEGYIEAELALYAAFRPDLVLIDNRPTARTSADKAGLPSVAVLNVHMSNYRAIPFFSYAQSLRSGNALVEGLDRLENRIEQRIYHHLVMGGLNRVRRRMGLDPLHAYAHEEGSQMSLFSDVPEFNPARDLPCHIHYVGPLTWHNDLPPPACLEVLDPSRPTVYFSLGSASLDELTPHLGALANEGVQAVVAGGAAAEEVGEVSPGVHVERYVNVDTLLPHCQLVCCHGGNGTLYQALGHGMPCVVVASHAEQHYGGKRIAQLGLGRSLTLKTLQRKGMPFLMAAVREVLQQPAYRRQAQQMQAYIRRWPAVETSMERLAPLLS